MKLVLQEGEKVSYKGSPNSKILVLWFLKSIFLALILMFFLSWVLAGLIFGFLFTGSVLVMMYAYVTSYIILLIIVFLYHVALRRTYKYHITTERVIFEGGILLRRIKNVPYHKITDVSISQNIFERALGLSKVNIHTAGTGMQKAEIQFVGLTDSEKPQSIIMKELRTFKSSKRHASTYSD